MPLSGFAELSPPRAFAKRAQISPLSQETERNLRNRLILLTTLLLSFANLYHWAVIQEQKCRVKITIIDAKTKKPIPGVIRCLSQSGEQAIPVTGLLARGQGLDEKSVIQGWYVISEPCEVLLPRQPLRLEAFSGVETEMTTVSIDLTGQNEKALTIPLRYFSQISQQGWYSGNTHLHLSNLSKEQADQYLKEIPRADRLDILFISYLERAVVDKDYITNRYPIGDLKELWSTGVLINNGEEHRHNFGEQGEGFGHVMLLNIKNLIQPVSIGPGISRRGSDGMPLQHGIEEAHRQGGVAVWCHNNWGMEDIPNFVSGKLDAQNIFDGGSHGSYEDSFYHFLNAGIRVPFSTGTDWFMYDLSRVYVRVVGSLGIKPWLDALVAGRSFISNGPLFRFNIDGKEVGDTVDLKSAKAVEVSGEAIGRINFEKLELLQNGEVIAETAPQARSGHFEARLDRDIKITEPSWLALRVSAKASNEYGRPLFGHTSPIYVKLGGKSIRKAEEVQFLIQQMEQARQTMASKALFPTKTERDRVLAVYDRGIEVLRGKVHSLTRSKSL